MKTAAATKGTIVLYLASFMIHICTMFELYRKYFEYLCTVHPDLLHVDESGKKIFQVIDVEEAYGDMRVNVVEKGFIFRLITPTWALTGHDQPLKKVIGGFIVAKYNSSREGGTADFFQAMDESERVCNDFSSKILADSGNGHPLFQFSTNTLNELNWNASPLAKTGDGSYSGWLCTFQFSNHINICISNDAPDWKTPTPKDL